FDKTGTLTMPHFADVQTFNGASKENALRLAAALARESHHPLARAIATACGDTTLPLASQVKSEAGLGLRGVIGGRELKLGSSRSVASDLRLKSPDAILLADPAGVIAAFHVTEQLRPGMRDVVDALKAQGLQLHVVSGDALAKVADIARKLDIADWQ